MNRVEQRPRTEGVCMKVVFAKPELLLELEWERKG
jgi:hypothetical protein